MNRTKKRLWRCLRGSQHQVPLTRIRAWKRLHGAMMIFIDPGGVEQSVTATRAVRRHERARRTCLWRHVLVVARLMYQCAKRALTRWWFLDQLSWRAGLGQLVKFGNAIARLLGVVLSRIRGNIVRMYFPRIYTQQTCFVKPFSCIWEKLLKMSGRL